MMNDSKVYSHKTMMEETEALKKNQIKERFNKIKNHIYENRDVYIAATIGVVVGVVTVLVILAIQSEGEVPEISMPRFLSPGDNNVMKVIINPLGDPGNVVQCIETGTVYASQGQAARELGVDASRISEHLSGKLPHIKGLHLTIIGKAGQPLAE